MSGRGVIDARLAGGNTATQIYDRDETKKEEIKTTPTIEMPTDTKFEDMYRKAIDSPMSSEETTKMRKRHNKQRALAAIIDGVSALGNVYFASRGAGANGTTNFSGAIGNRWREYWDKVRTDRDAYNKGLLQARQMDYNANIRKLERAEDKAERDAVRAQQQSNWETTRQDGLMKDAQQQSNWQTIFDANEAHRQTELGIAKQNANTSALKARGDYVAYDENGKLHYFDNDVSADNFARDHGTLGERVIEVETTYTDEDGETKTRKERRPVTYRKGPNEIKKTGADKKPNPMT